MDSETRTTISFAEFEIDLERNRLMRDGEALALHAKAFELLVYLIENAGRTLTKEEILEAVWENQFVEEANLAVQISALRKALGDRKDAPRFLVTVPGKGYKFVAGFNAQARESLIIETEKVQTITITEDYPGGSIARALLGVPVARSFPKNWHLAAFALVTAAALAITGYFLLTKRTNTFAASPNLVLKKLTSNGGVRTAALSSDGKFFAYTTERRNERSLWVGNVDGGEPIMIRPFADVDFISISFAPDSGSLFYAQTDSHHVRGDLYRIPIFGGAPEKVHNDVSSPAVFSADGKQFVFARTDAAKNRSVLVIADLASGSERELVTRPLAQRFAGFSPSWSPDGKTMAFGALSEDPATLQFFTANISDGTVRQLSTDGWHFIRSTAWLKDGSGILLIGEQKDSFEDRWQIYHVSYPDGVTRQFNPDLNSYGSTLNLSSDGKTLGVIKEELTSNIWVAPVEDLGQAKQVTFGSLGRKDGWSGLDWTPNGEIFYTSVADKTKTIWKMDADGSNQKQIIPNGGENIYLNNSDDNRFVVFQSNRSGSRAAWLANADGSDMRQIADGSTGQPAISPDGRLIVYQKGSDDGGELWCVSTDGGQPVRLVEKGAGWPRFSPDGKLIAYLSKIDGKTKLAIMSIDGGEPLKLFETALDLNVGTGLRWRPDGKAIAYRDWFDGIWLQTLDRSGPERLEGLPREKLYSFDWSPDGKFFAYTRSSEMRDVMLIGTGK